MINEDLWILELKATAVSPLYTGENKLESQKRRKQGNLLPTRMSGDGFASISIFGAIRGYAEKIYKGDGTCDTGKDTKGCGRCLTCDMFLSLIHISEPTRLGMISYAVFCLKKYKI